MPEPTVPCGCRHLAFVQVRRDLGERFAVEDACSQLTNDRRFGLNHHEPTAVGDVPLCVQDQLCALIAIGTVAAVPTALTRTGTLGTPHAVTDLPGLTRRFDNRVKRIMKPFVGHQIVACAAGCRLDHERSRLYVQHNGMDFQQVFNAPEEPGDLGGNDRLDLPDANRRQQGVVTRSLFGRILRRRDVIVREVQRLIELPTVALVVLLNVKPLIGDAWASFPAILREPFVGCASHYRSFGGSRVVPDQRDCISVQRFRIGVLAAFLLYLRRFFDPMQELSQFYNSLQSGGAAVEKLAGVLEEAPSVPEPEQPVALGNVAGAVRFSGVRFGYRSDRPVIPTLDLELPAGQTVALVGATGAGKTTIARLLARFYDPDEGRVTLDGVDLRRLAERDLRRAVVIVTQESFLFSGLSSRAGSGGTVADNIRFGRPKATSAEIERAARAIGAHEFIAALPDGYATEVGKRGGRLSAGQRQLVAFARAFLADPAVLILDEATSSLDVPSERLVQRALRTILADRTAVIIAHRLSTVEIADRVLVVHDGRIVEDGPPGELVRGTGRYADLRQAWLDSLV